MKKTKEKQGVGGKGPAKGPNPAKRVESEALFLELENRLLRQLLDETEVVSLRRLFKQAASEAAGLAWTTPFPLLLFPTLFAEKAQELRLQGKRQQIVRARSEELIHFKAV